MDVRREMSRKGFLGIFARCAALLPKRSARLDRLEDELVSGSEVDD